MLCVPIGSCEQHGPHLPLATDTIIADALAEHLADRRPSIVITPTLGITASGEHTGFPGTLSIGTETTAAVIVELVRSADWADGVILVNGHGGNRDAVDRATATLAHDGRRTLAWWPRVDGDDADAHAGHVETSLLLFLRPDLVRVEQAEIGATAPLAQLAGALRASGVRGVSSNGILGDPTHADAGTGAALFASLADDLVAAVDAWIRSGR